jgi:hypothetical protein
MPGTTSTAPTKVIDNEFGSLIYYPDKKIVHHMFKKPIGGEHLRNLLMAGVDLLKTNGATKWLSDDRGNSALSEEDSKWGVEVWFPQAKAAGWLYWALVVPHDMLGRINMTEFVMNYAQQGIRVAVFTEPEKALEWLQTL